MAMKVTEKTLKERYPEFSVRKKYTTGTKYNRTRYFIENEHYHISLYRDTNKLSWISDEDLKRYGWKRTHGWNMKISPWLDYQKRMTSGDVPWESELTDEQVFERMDALHHRWLASGGT